MTAIDQDPELRPARFWISSASGVGTPTTGMESDEEEFMNLDFRFLNVRQSRFIFYAINVPSY
jgi:hypothetical protein